MEIKPHHNQTAHYVGPLFLGVEIRNAPVRV
jgi:hypothetical protein